MELLNTGNKNKTRTGNGKNGEAGTGLVMRVFRLA